MAGPTSRFVIAQDGLKLHVRDYPGPMEQLPVVCLAGLARSGADFEPLAITLAADPRQPRRVIAIDARGRGKSDYDRDPASYNLAVELSDILQVLTTLAIERAVFVGTSRGGILAMLLAAARPAAIAGCVLNDIGPEVELAGVLRIKSYVGKLPQPQNLQEAAVILRRLFGTQFTRLGEADWLSYAHRTYRNADGQLVPDYDPKLSGILQGVDADHPLPAMWEQFDALVAAPVLVIRGANSDILSAATVAAMQARSTRVETFEVMDQGHAPLLAEADVIARIRSFVAACGV